MRIAGKRLLITGGAGFIGSEVARQAVALGARVTVLDNFANGRRENVAGLPVEVPGLTVNRLCGSGLQAIVSAAQHILLGDTDTVVAGGAESMSRAAYFLPTGRWGQRMSDSAIVDAMTGALIEKVHESPAAEAREAAADKKVAKPPVRKP